MDTGDEWNRDTMNGKGDKRRPMDVQFDQFESNWDRIFRRKQIEEHWTPEVKEKMGQLNEVCYDGMWQHSCTVDMRVVYIGKDETCNMCGAWEEDGQ